MSVFLKIALFIISIRGIWSLNKDVPKAFEQFKIVPDVVDKAPKNLVNVSYGNQKVHLGNTVSQNVIQEAPSVKFAGETGKYYTLLSLNPDNPTPQDYGSRNGRQWLIANIPGPSDVDSGKLITKYYPPNMFPNEFLYYRLVFLIFEQPEGEIDYQIEKNRSKFNVTAFSQEYNLSTPVFGNFFTTRSRTTDVDVEKCACKN